MIDKHFDYHVPFYAGGSWVVEFVERMDIISKDCLSHTVKYVSYNRVPRSYTRPLWSALTICTSRALYKDIDMFPDMDIREFTAYCVANAICVALRDMYPFSNYNGLIKIEQWVLRCFEANKLLEEDLFEYGEITKVYKTVKIK